MRFVTVMHRNNYQRQQRNVEHLEAIAEGQEQRTVLEDTRHIYISKCRVMTRILNELEGVDSEGNNVRALALDLDEDENAAEYIGAARGVYRLNLPIRPDTARRLFAAISVDTTLPKKRRRVAAVERREEERRLYPDNPEKRGIDLTVCSVYERIRKVVDR